MIPKYSIPTTEVQDALPDAPPMTSGLGRFGKCFLYDDGWLDAALGDLHYTGWSAKTVPRPQGSGPMYFTRLVASTCKNCDKVFATFAVQIKNTTYF